MREETFAHPITSMISDESIVRQGRSQNFRIIDLDSKQHPITFQENALNRRNLYIYIYLCFRKLRSQRITEIIHYTVNFSVLFLANTLPIFFEATTAMIFKNACNECMYRIMYAINNGDFRDEQISYWPNVVRAALHWHCCSPRFTDHRRVSRLYRERVNSKPCDSLRDLHY